MSRGKREKRKIPTLHSYILSLASLVLCCAMFMSATMAWFTSEVTTTGIKVYAGTLKVALRDENDVSLHGKTGVLFNRVYLPPEESGASTAIAGASENTVTHWQDGAESFARLQVVNEGDLAFTYSLYLTAEGGSAEETGLASTANNGETVNLTDYFEVWYKAWPEGWPATGDGYISPAALAQNGWTKVTVGEGDAARDTLTAILEEVVTTDGEGTVVRTGHGTPIFTSTMTAAEIAAAKGTETAAAHRYTVALRMKSDGELTMIEVDDAGESVTLSIMGQTVTLGVKLVASQTIEVAADDDAENGGTSATGSGAGDPVDGTAAQSAGGENAVNGNSGNAAANAETEPEAAGHTGVTPPDGEPVSM